MWTRNGSLRTRLALLFGLMLLVGGLLLLLAAHSLARRSADQVYDKLLESAALTAMDSLSVIDQRLHFDLPYASLATLALSENDRVLYSLIDSRAQVLTGYDFVSPDKPEQMQASHQQGRPYFFTGYHDGEDFRFVVLERLLLESTAQGKVYLQMGQSRLARNRLAADLTFKAMLGVAGLIVLGGLSVWLAAGWPLRPLLAIEQALLQRQPTDLRPLDTAVPGEAEQLVEAINRFMSRLQRNQDRNHAFIAEAAHQLRTPLAGLQAQAELAAEERNPDGFQDRARRILRNARETNSRINQLLSYATLAHRADVLMPEQLLLADAVSQILADLAPLALQQGVELSFDNPVGDVQVSADPEALREVLRNLVDNALKYGHPPGQPPLIQVSLEAAADPAQVVLQVRDFGPGVPAELLQQVTRRFGRGEFHQQGGSGLGLAIVEQIMHGMGGHLELENGRQGGLKARLYLNVSHAP
ncbi:MAG: sensor histidine kinase [Thiolinea sp.]